MDKIAAVVVLFNPEMDVLENIKTYIDQVGKVYVIDNSQNFDKALIKEIKLFNNVEYTWNQYNKGIAFALNLGAQKALKDNFEYLLTMDQDSKVPNEMVKKLYDIFKNFPKAGIVAAEHINSTFQKGPGQGNTKEILFTMTSGNLLSLSVYKTIGGFLDELFIDHVDHEYCLRLNRNGFKVIKTSEIIVYHQLGNAIEKKFLNFNFCPTNHSPIRLYYRTRNRFYVDNLYKDIFPEYIKIDRRNLVREMIEILFYEKDLFQKLRMMMTGYRHYKKNILGVYSNNK